MEIGKLKKELDLLVVPPEELAQLKDQLQSETLEKVTLEKEIDTQKEKIKELEERVKFPNYQSDPTHSEFRVPSIPITPKAKTKKNRKGTTKSVNIHYITHS